MDKNTNEHLGQHPRQFDEIQNYDCNVTINETDASTTRVMNIGILNPPLKILNRSTTTVAPSCSRTTPVTPLVHYQTLHKIPTPCRIVSQPPMPPRTNTITTTTQAFPITNQLLNIQTGTYTTVSYPHQNLSNASGSSYGTPIAPRTTSWQPAPNVLRCYYTVPKGYDEGASTSRNPPEIPKMDNTSKCSGRAQKPRHIQISKNNLTALEAVAVGDSTNKATQSSSVASFLEQDTLRKGVEVLDSLDDQSLKLLVSKVMDLTNKMYGDYLAEELEKYLGVEKYQEIANNALNTYDEFLARRSCDVGKENRRPASSTSCGLYSEAEVSASDVKGQNQASFSKMEPKKSLLRTNNVTANATGKVEIAQKSKGKKKIVDKAQSRVSYDIEDSLAVLSAFESSKTSTRAIKSIKQENESVQMNGFAWTDSTKTVAVRVNAQEEISVADAFITNKIAELKEGDTRIGDNLEEDFTFDDSKGMSGCLPEKIFESPDDPPANRLRISLRDKCQPRKLLQVDGVDKNCSTENEPFLEKDLTVKDEIGGDTPTVDPITVSSKEPSSSIDSRQVGDATFKIVKPRKYQQIPKRGKSPLKSDPTLTVDVPSSNLQAPVDGSQFLPKSIPKMSEMRPNKHYQQPIKREKNFLKIVPLPRPFPPVAPNMTPVRSKQSLKSESTFDVDQLLSTPSERVSVPNQVMSLSPEISFGSSSSALESTSSVAAKIVEEALAQTSKVFDVQMCVEVESNESEPNWIVELTPSIEFVNGGTRGPDIVKNPTCLPDKSCKKVDHEPTDDNLVNLSLPNDERAKSAPKMWRESEFVYKSNCPQASTVAKKIKSVFITQSRQKVDQDPTKNSLANISLSPCPPNGQGRSITGLQQESEYGPQTIVLEKVEQAVVIPQGVTVEHSLNSCKNDGSESSSFKEPKEPTIIKENLPAENEHNITAVQGTPKRITFLEIPDEKQIESAKKDIIPKRCIETPCLLSNPSQKNTKKSIADNFPESCDEFDHIIQMNSTTETAAQRPHTLKDQMYKIQNVSQIIIKPMSPRSDSNQHNEDLARNSHGNKVDKENVSETSITTKSGRGDHTDYCHAPLRQINLTDNSTLTSTNTAKLEEQVSQKSLGLEIQKLKKDGNEKSEQMLQKNDNDTPEQKPQKLEKDDNDISEQKPIKFEDDGNENPEQKPQKFEKDDNDTSEQKPIKLEDDGNENPEQKPQKFEKDDNDTSEQKPIKLEDDGYYSPQQKSQKFDGNDSSDIETSMNDLAQLLISLQETTPIAKGASDTSSISNESFEKFAQNTVKTLSLENDDCILIEDEDASTIAGEVTGVLPQSSDSCELFVRQTPEFCEVNGKLIPGTSKMTGKQKVTDSIRGHKDKSVRNIAQLLMDFQKSLPNGTDVELKSGKVLNKKVGSDDCVMVEEDTTPIRDPLEIISPSDKSILNSTEDCVLVEVESFPLTAKCVRNGNYDSKRSKVSESPLVRVLPTPSGLKRTKESCETFDAYRAQPLKKNKVYEQDFIKRNPLSWAREHGYQQPSTTIRILDFARSSSSSNNLPYSHYRNTNDPRKRPRLGDFNSPNGPYKPTVVPNDDLPGSSSHTFGKNFPIPVALVASARTDINSKKNDVMSPSRIIDVNLSACRGGVDAFRKLDFKSAGCESIDANQSHFITPEVTISRRTNLQEQSTTESNVKPVTIIKLRPDHVKVEDDGCRFVDLRKSIVETPSASRHREAVVPGIRRMRELRKREEHRQRNVLRSKVRTFTQIIRRRIKAVRRTFNQLSIIVNLINLNRNDVSLDNYALKSKVKNLKTIYHKVNKTFFAAFNRNDAQQLKTAFRDVRKAREGRATVAKTWRDVPSASRSATTNVSKDEDTKDLFPVPQFKKMKPTKTYSKDRNSIIKNRWDSNVGETTILGNEADVPFKRSFLDDVRQSSLGRDEVQQIFFHDDANPESLVTKNVGNETIPDPLEMLQRGAAMSVMEMVVVKEEPLEVPEWEEVKDEKFESDPITRGIKRKASDRKKPMKKEQSTGAKTMKLRTSTVSEPTPPSRNRKPGRTTDVRRSYALRSRRTSNRKPNPWTVCISCPENTWTTF